MTDLDREVANILKNLLLWSDRLGKDEIYTIQEAIARLKGEI